MQKLKGLRRRWLINTVGLVCLIGFVCVIVVTAFFAAHYYAQLETDMRQRVETTATFFSDSTDQTYEDLYQSCIDHTTSFELQNDMYLQFINTSAEVVASTVGEAGGYVGEAKDVKEALEAGQIEKFVGRDALSNGRVMAVSAPVMYKDGRVVGVIRYLSLTQKVDRQITIVACISFAVLMLVLCVVLISGNFYIRSILLPVSQIVEKAKMVANGSYGIQIQTQFDDEIGELAQTINDMSMQINQNEKSQTEFISSLSHELRTPLTAITGWSETLLNSDDLDENTRRGVKIILGEGKRLTEMVLELLDFTRIQDGRMTLNMEPTDLRGEFEDTVFMYGSRLAQDGIRLEYLDHDEDIPEISCDPKRLRQVFLNILDNAAKHGGDGKRIDADIVMDDGYVVVRIRDYGIGIPEDELSLVKRKFYKGSSKARGSGIGLAVCDEIVQMHGGELTLENAPGGGTLVRIELPVTQ